LINYFLVTRTSPPACFGVIEEPDNITLESGRELEIYYSNYMKKKIKLAFDTLMIEA
jgi:hypothetical protein